MTSKELEKELEIQKHIEHLGITREQAEQLWLEDNTDFENEEMKGMRERAKQDRRYEKSDKPRKENKREKKLDSDKVKIISDIFNSLRELGYDVNIANPQREITFDNYSITLTRHKKK